MTTEAQKYANKLQSNAAAYYAGEMDREAFDQAQREVWAGLEDRPEVKDAVTEILRRAIDEMEL